jgi:hypothetical protein
MQGDNLILSNDNFTFNQFENTTVGYETTHTIFCNSNEIPFIPNSMMISSESNTTYDAGTTLFYICQSGYESLSNQSISITCSMNGTWSIDTDNITMCQLSKITVLFE